MSPEAFVVACHPFTFVSHETLDKLKIYVELLHKWQSKINLVSASTLGDVWQRHIFDSAQLLHYIRAEDRVVDFGSGAGFPAMVLSLMGVQQVTVIESDQRKIAFLQEVARQTQSSVVLINKRIEQVDPFSVDVITARAFASLSDILDHASGWWQPATKGVFLKGKNVKEELTAAQAKWHIKFQCDRSCADPDGSVLIIEEVKALSV